MAIVVSNSMKIGIDISQIVYNGTGVARYVEELVAALVKIDTTNEYILFGSSLRQQKRIKDYVTTLQKTHKNIQLRLFPFPPLLLDILWNRLHILSIERLIGNIDIFWSSDWSQPPLKTAKGITTIHDLIVYKHPYETAQRISFNPWSFIYKADIVSTQKRRLNRAIDECGIFLCDSEATKRDMNTIFGVSIDKLKVIYPGFTV